MDGIVQVRGSIRTKKGDWLAGCKVLVGDQGLVVVGSDDSELLRLEPRQFVDIGFPGFFAGRAFLELPLGEEDEDGEGKVLLLQLAAPELAVIRDTVDRLIGEHSSDAVADGLVRQWRLFSAGVGVIVSGSLVCLLGYGMAAGIGIGVIFYGIPIAGVAMVCKSASQIRRLRRILRGVGIDAETAV